jgi:hypothetical protein
MTKKIIISFIFSLVVFAIVVALKSKGCQNIACAVYECDYYSFLTNCGCECMSQSRWLAEKFLIHILPFIAMFVFLSAVSKRKNIQ